MYIATKWEVISADQDADLHFVIRHPQYGKAKAKIIKYFSQIPNNQDMSSEDMHVLKKT